MDENQIEETMKSRDVNWSEMCSDALQLILESLNIPDFHRAKTVCSSWYSVSKSCAAGSRNRHPWLILFLDNSSVRVSCKLFDPVDKKTYSARHLVDEFSECRHIASYGNWLLMLTPRIDFSVLNIFTGERINLPSLSQSARFERKTEGGLFFLQHSWLDRETVINRFIDTAVLWIDEKTKDFVVSWIYKNQYLFSYKKGDGYGSWWHLQDTKCLAMAYKDQRLCVYTSDHYIKIFDYSRDFPIEIIEENPYLNHPLAYEPQPWEYIWKWRVAITDSGDVLIIVSLKDVSENEEKRLFYIFKMNLQGHEWERVDSLGNQMLVFGDGFTLTVASDIGGGLVYFVPDDVWPLQTDHIHESSTGVFDLAKTEIRCFNRPIYNLCNIRWFVPGSDKK